MKKADEILNKILDEKNRKLGASYTSVFGSWSHIVGESLAEHSRIYEIAGGCLLIEVDHPGWMQLLLMKKNKILRSVKRKHPTLAIRNLHVRVKLRYAASGRMVADEEPVAGEEAEKVSTEPAGDTDQNRELDQILSSVNHDELKQRLRRLFKKSMEKGSSGRG